MCLRINKQNNRKLTSFFLVHLANGKPVTYLAGGFVCNPGCGPSGLLTLIHMLLQVQKVFLIFLLLHQYI